MPIVWLGKLRLLEVMPAIGPLPVPARFTVWGLPGALSAMLTEAGRDPIPPGVKVTLTVQLPLAARLAGHVLVTS